MKSQTQQFYSACDRAADANNFFMELVRNGLTKRELEVLIAKHPSLWGRFSSWLEKL